jgi:hypothetical protein
MRVHVGRCCDIASKLQQWNIVTELCNSCVRGLLHRGQISKNWMSDVTRLDLFEDLKMCEQCWSTRPTFQHQRMRSVVAKCFRLVVKLGKRACDRRDSSIAFIQCTGRPISDPDIPSSVRTSPTSSIPYGRC